MKQTIARLAFSSREESATVISSQGKRNTPPVTRQGYARHRAMVTRGSRLVDWGLKATQASGLRVTLNLDCNRRVDCNVVA